MDNNFCVVAPNLGTYYLFPEETTSIDPFGGRSHIVNYKGQVWVRVDLCLRRDRYRSSSRSQGAGEVGQLDEGFADGAIPDSLRETNLPQKPISEARANEARRVPEEIIKRQINLMHERGIWVKPDH